MKNDLHRFLPGRWAGLLAGLLLLAAGLAPAQTPTPGRLLAPAVEMAAEGTPFLIRLPAGPGQLPALAKRQQVLQQQLGLGANDELRPLRTETDALGFVHERYQQYYRGVKVEHGQYSLHARNGRIEALSGELKRPAAGLRTAPALGEAAALMRALAAVGARRYKWQEPAEEAELRRRTGNVRATYRPTGELVLVDDFRQPKTARPLVLAWKFNVYAQQPVSRDLLYVDARTGDVLLRDAIIKHLDAPGTMATRYVGTRTGTTEAFAGGYRLRETTRSKGITTLNMRQGTSFAGATDFVDNDNNWTATEYNNAALDNVALDAHIGAQTTQDYWVTQHGRDSYDNRGTVLLSYVHYGVAFDNAFWDGTEMVYGDGMNRFRPLTAVDVCGHEIGHAVCQTTANLVYQNESGALNEGFSDIWGACVENHLDPTKQIWLVGEDIDLLRPSLRSMSNPNAENQPDTYLGLNWYSGSADRGGVHTNSGVLNFWFYLLSVGGTGTNDFNTAYAVAGISIEKAARIAYRAEQFYLTPNSDYAAARTATLQAAVDLYGFGSAEVTAVAQAWKAVGLGQPAPTVSGLAPASGPVGQVVTITGSNLSNVFRVVFNGTAATAGTLLSATQLSVEVPAGATTGPVVLTTASGTATSPGVFTVTGTGAVPAIVSYAPMAGQRIGQPVVITGTNLGGTTALTIGGAAAIFSVDSPTQLTATVPVVAASGQMTATTPDGTARVGFAVLPYLASLAPASGTTGTVVALSGTSLAGALAVKFNGVYATFVATGVGISTTVPPGATTGPVTVRTLSGTATSLANFVVNPTLGVTSFLPTSGVPSVTAVTIRGRGFTGTTAVAFGGVAATAFTVASDTELWVTAPAAAVSGVIGVSSPLGTAQSSGSFLVLVPGVPVVSRLFPASGMVGTTVTLSGSNFVGATAVAFNGVAAPGFAVLSNTSLVVTVPTGASTGPISVVSAVGVGQSSGSYVVVVPAAPVVSAFSPGSGVVGTDVAVSGNDFFRTTSVTFNGVAATRFRVNSNNDILATIPVGATTGPIRVATALGTGTSSASFVVTVPGAPVVTNFTPRSGSAGTVVDVYGRDFLGATAVAFNGTAASAFTAVSNTRLTATVPVGATTGPVSVSTPVGTGQSTANFVVTIPGAPSVDFFTPPAGAVGTVVDVYGTDFFGTTAVAFNGTAATGFTVLDNYTLIATVPVGATTGPIRVATPLGTGTSSANFVVAVPGVPFINSFTPTAGAPSTTVQLYGAEFAGTTAVTFNGTAATAFSVFNTNSLTATVPPGATTGPIRVTTPLGTGTSATNFAVPVPPTNDLCSTAVPVLACGGSVSGSTLWATTTGDPTGTCTASISPAGGVFYRLTGASGTVTLSMCGGTSYDSELFVFSGTCGNYVCVTGNDDFCGRASSVTFAASSGTDYLVYVSGYGSSQGTFTLAATCAGTGPALALTGLVPAANARAAARSSALTATFNQPLAVASAGALKVFSSQRGGLRSRSTTPAVASGNTLSFAPTPYPWVPGETVRYTLTTAVAGSGGGNLAPARVGQFTAAVGGTGRGVFQGGGDLPADVFPFVMGDVDGDGDLDALTTSATLARVQRNNGSGVFAAGGTLPLPAPPTSALLGDVDGDGDLDLVLTVGAAGNSMLSIRLNNGSGVFAGGTDLRMGSSTPFDNVAAGDVDGDGDLDLVVSSDMIGGGEVVVRLNNSSGIFSNGGGLTLPGAPQKIDLADVDGDGDLDLLTSNGYAGTASVRLNDGSGIFAGGSNPVATTYPSGMAVGDIDGDGDLDLLTGSTFASLVNIQRNNGQGTFSGSDLALGVGLASGVALADVDGDGDLDLLAVTQGPAGTVIIRLNNGGGLFSVPPPGTGVASVGLNPYAMHLGDVDGDGDLDLLALVRGNATTGVPTLNIRLNQRTLATGAAAASPAFTLAPNPAHGSVALTGAAPRASIAVFDALGRLVLTATADAAGTARLTLPAGLAPGVYLVRCGAQVRRLAVE